MHTLARDRVQVRGQHTGERLALTGLHLGDLTEMQGGATHELHVEVTLAQGAVRALAGDGEGLGQQLVECLAVGVAAPELLGLGRQLGVGESDDVAFERVDVRSDFAQALEGLALTGAEQSGQDHPVDLTT